MYRCVPFQMSKEAYVFEKAQVSFIFIVFDIKCLKFGVAKVLVKTQPSLPHIRTQSHRIVRDYLMKI